MRTTLPRAPGSAARDSERRLGWATGIARESSRLVGRLLGRSGSSADAPFPPTGDRRATSHLETARPPLVAGVSVDDCLCSSDYGADELSLSSSQWPGPMSPVL